MVRFTCIAQIFSSCSLFTFVSFLLCLGCKLELLIGAYSMRHVSSLFTVAHSLYLFVCSGQHFIGKGRAASMHNMQPTPLKLKNKQTEKHLTFAHSSFSVRLTEQNL